MGFRHSGAKDGCMEEVPEGDKKMNVSIHAPVKGRPGRPDNRGDGGGEQAGQQTD